MTLLINNICRATVPMETGVTRPKMNTKLSKVIKT